MTARRDSVTVRGFAQKVTVRGGEAKQSEPRSAATGPIRKKHAIDRVVEFSFKTSRSFRVGPVAALRGLIACACGSKASPCGSTVKYLVFVQTHGTDLTTLRA